jgi:hypothetical protein
VRLVVDLDESGSLGRTEVLQCPLVVHPGGDLSSIGADGHLKLRFHWLPMLRAPFAIQGPVLPADFLLLTRIRGMRNVIRVGVAEPGLADAGAVRDPLTLTEVHVPGQRSHLRNP